MRTSSSHAWRHGGRLRTVLSAHRARSALAIPTALPDGTPFPGRDAALVLTVVVRLIWLAGQAPTVCPLIRWLGVMRARGGQDGSAEHRQRM